MAWSPAEAAGSQPGESQRRRIKLADERFRIIVWKRSAAEFISNTLSSCSRMFVFIELTQPVPEPWDINLLLFLVGFQNALTQPQLRALCFPELSLRWRRKGRSGRLRSVQRRLIRKPP